MNAAVLGLGDFLSKLIIRGLQSCQQTKTTFTMIFFIVFGVSLVYYIISDKTIFVIITILVLKCGIA